VRTTAGLRRGTSPVKIYRFDVSYFQAGVARSKFNSFEYRRNGGLDGAVEAQRFARARKRIGDRENLRFALPQGGIALGRH
jgi:hypothetical protein